MIKTALILAAGRGERLRPLTDTCPKAMCLVKGKPLIEHHVINFAKAGFEHLVINHAYLGGKIRQYLQYGQRYGLTISYSAEPPGALETAGAIVQALPLLGTSPFLTISADIYTDFPLSQITLPPQSCAHIVLAPVPAYLSKGDFGLEKDWVCDTPKTHTFANIACFNPALFQHLSLMRSPLGPLLKNLVEERKVSGEIYEGKWINIGTIAQLNKANNA